MEYTNESALSLRDFLVQLIVGEHQVTRSVIEMVPGSVLAHPAPVGERNLSDLMWFLVQYQVEALTAVCEGQSGPAMKRPEFASAAELLAWDEEHFGPVVERVSRLSAEELLRPLSMLGSEMPAIEYIPVYVTAQTTTRAHLAVALSQSGAVAAAPETEHVETDELGDEELSAIAGGVGNVPGYVYSQGDPEPGVPGLFGGRPGWGGIMRGPIRFPNPRHPRPHPNPPGTPGTPATPGGFSFPPRFGVLPTPE